MTSNAEVGGRDLLVPRLLPVAHEEDGLATAREHEPYRSEHVTVRRVVEKTGGAPDKTPVEQSEELADESYTPVRIVSPDVDEHTAHARDIGGEIAEGGVSTIAYRSRSWNRIMQFLTGGRSLELATNADRPVNALPWVDSGR